MLLLGLPEADAGTILLKLREHGFPDYKYGDLATGLKMGGQVAKYDALRNDSFRLRQLVTDWTDNVEEQGRWETIVTAVKMSGHKNVARALAQDLGIHFPN